MSKTFHICKWVSFAIQTLVTVDETPFGRKGSIHARDYHGNIFAVRKYTVLNGYNFAVPLTFMILIESFVDPQEHATGNSAMKKP